MALAACCEGPSCASAPILDEQHVIKAMSMVDNLIGQGASNPRLAYDLLSQYWRARADDNSPAGISSIHMAKSDQPDAVRKQILIARKLLKTPCDSLCLLHDS